MSESTQPADMPGFTEAELLDLAYMRQAYSQGWLTEQREVVAEQRCLDFARYLAEVGIINEFNI